MVLRASGLKATSPEAYRQEPPEQQLLKTSNAKKVVFPQHSNLQPFDYPSTALPLELEKTSPRMLEDVSSQLFRIACF